MWCEHILDSHCFSLKVVILTEEKINVDPVRITIKEQSGYDDTGCSGCLATSPETLKIVAGVANLSLQQVTMKGIGKQDGQR